MKIAAIRSIRQLDQPSDPIFLKAGEMAELESSPTKGGLDVIELDHLYVIVRDKDGDQLVRQGRSFSHKVKTQEN